MFDPFSLEFYLNYKVSIEIQGLASTDCNFQGLLNSSRKDSYVKGARILVGEQKTNLGVALALLI